MKTEEHLIVGGPRDGERVAIEGLPERISLRDPLTAAERSSKTGRFVSEVSTKIIAIPATIYYREVLRTGDERWYVYVAESIPRDRIIPALLAGYRQAARDERA